MPAQMVLMDRGYQSMPYLEQRSVLPADGLFYRPSGWRGQGWTDSTLVAMEPVPGRRPLNVGPSRPSSSSITRSRPCLAARLKYPERLGFGLPSDRGRSGWGSGNQSALPPLPDPAATIRAQGRDITGLSDEMGADRGWNVVRLGHRLSHRIPPIGRQSLRSDSRIEGGIWFGHWATVTTGMTWDR
jgi:hypothetical protein